MARSRDWDRARGRERRRPRKDPTLPTAKQPTPKQLRYLRTLALRTGTTFVSPRTSWDASREIDRLRTLPPK